MEKRTSKLIALAPPSWHDQLGITGLETAIVLIAFVVVSSVFAFAALSTGLFTADKARETIRSGLSEARGTLEIKGPIIAKAVTGDGGNVTEFFFQVGNAAGGDFIDLTPGETIIKYTDKNQTQIFTGGSTFAFSASGVGNADADKLVEPGELYEINMTGLGSLGTTLKTGDIFTVEVLPPRGAVLTIQRTTPVALNIFNDLG